MHAVDVVVVGGGPAGLNAALVLARACKSVALVDAGSPRNARSTAANGVFANDGVAPAALRERARGDLVRYGVTLVDAAVDAVEPGGRRFAVRVGGDTFDARRVLLATGVVDVLPRIAGIEERWGRDVFGCPHCHAWEHRGKRIGVLATRPHQVSAALAMTGWSPHVTMFTNAELAFDDAATEKLRAQGVEVERRAIRAAVVTADALTGVAVDGDAVALVDALFLQTAQRHVPLVEEMATRELVVLAQGYIEVDAAGGTRTRGLHAAGDLTRGHQQVVIAAAEGARVAMAMAASLTSEREPPA